MIRAIEEYLSKQEDGYLSEDDLDVEKSDDDEHHDAHEITTLLKEENTAENDEDSTAEDDPLLIETIEDYCSGIYLAKTNSDRQFRNEVAFVIRDKDIVLQAKRGRPSLSILEQNWRQREEKVL
ncbi:unnamed protein product [Parnassius apollo]|uniref:(apollo) hypothetical protein n=1 Tax=Parnassius apollo TaxID=110799 RepID=A0A8S3X878_PARAO|nr:unnamed protein product [Parnassius apollo]